MSRICHFVPIFQVASGVSTFAGEIANVQASLGSEVTIATLPQFVNAHYPISDSVRVVDMVRGIDWGNNRRPDVVHIHGLWTLGLHRVVSKAVSAGVPIVWSPHGMLAPWAMAHKRWKKWPVWHLWQRRDLLRAKVLHVTSDLEVNWIRRLGFTQNVVTVPLGTNLPSIVAREALSAGDSHVLLFVGRIYPVKGLVNLLQAWGMLESSGNSQVHKWMIRLVGPDQAGHAEELKKLAERLGISNSVIFTGPLFGEELAKEYRRADCFVLPSFTENFGGVVVDALSYGVPVIATQGTPWQGLEQEKCGRWVPIGVEPLAVTLKEMMAMSDEERAAMGARGRRLIEEKYTWPAIAQRMKEGYESLKV